MAKIVNRLAEHLEVKKRDDGRDYTYEDVGKGAGVHPNTVGRLIRQEVRRPDLETVAKLCLWLGIKPEQFLTWSSSSFEVEDDDSSKELGAPLPIPA